MESIIFHVGIPKTGSSAIQVFLAKNRELLIKQSLDYLNIGEIGLGSLGRISSGNGSFLARSLLPVASPAHIKSHLSHFDEFFPALTRSSCKVGVVSSEMFVDATVEGWEALLDDLKSRGVRPRAFFYVRRQDQFMMSSFIQQVKRHQYVGSAAKFALENYRSLRFLRYQSFYDHMCGLFGLENVGVYVYESDMVDQSGLLGSVADALSFDLSPLNTRIGDINTGLSQKEVSMMIVLNQFKPRMNFSDAVVNNSCLLGLSKSGTTHDLLPEEIATMIMEYYNEENDKLARSVFGRKELFTSNSLSRRSRPLSDYPEISDILSFLGGLVVNLDQRTAELENRIREIERLLTKKSHESTHPN